MARGYDVTRRSYDLLDPAGRALFLVDDDGRRLAGRRQLPGRPGRAPRFEPGRRRPADRPRAATGSGRRSRSASPGPDDPAELWDDHGREPRPTRPRSVKVVPYLEWVLNQPDADRGHTQYNRLFAEMEYAAGLHAVLAWDKHAKAMGVLASDVAPEGFLTSRVDFIGRARSLWTPRVLETLAFSEPPGHRRPPDLRPDRQPAPAARPSRPAGRRRVRLLIGLVARQGGRRST